MATPTSTKLYWGTPGTGDTTAYTVPAATTTYLKEVWICNTTGSAATLTMNIVNSGGAVATGNQVLGAKSIPANDIVIIACYQHMNTGDVINLKQGTGSALNVRISGVEVA